MTLYAMVLFAMIGQGDPSTLLQQGRTEYRLGHYGASEKLYLSVLGMLAPDDEEKRAVTLGQLGDAYASEDDLPKAEQAYSDSLKLFRRTTDTVSTTLVMRNLGSVYSAQHRNDEATRLLQEALKLAKSPGSNISVVAAILNSIGNHYYRQGKLSKAETYFNKALRMTSGSKIPFDTAGLLNNLATIYIRQRKFDKAEAFLKQSLEMREKEVGVSHPDITIPLHGLAVLYSETGRYSEAQAQFRRSLKILEGRGPDYETLVARALYSLSGMYLLSGKKDEAFATLAEAAALARRNVRKHPEMPEIMDEYSAALKVQGKTAEAEQFRTEAKRARITSSLVIRAHHP